jgi:lipoprotein-releasing system ATP-binding protein
MVEAAAPAVRAKGLIKTYRSGGAPVEVLRGCDLEAAPGEFVAVLGPSGSGKSTLLHILGLMDRCDSGELTLRGRQAARLTELERSRLRSRELGFVFQFDSMLPEFTILENVLMPARIAAAHGLPLEGAEARALSLLESLGVSGAKDRFPTQTSGGERQRAAVARALLNKPALLLADEPTGNLDRDNGRRVFEDFRRVSVQEKAAVILVTHDEANARAADRVLRMDAGRLRPA